jgi:hypothetical protein
MRIYLAGSAAARYRVAIYAADLENLGHRVTSRWHRRSDPHTDSVLYTSQPNRVAELAREDFRGMLEAHVLLAFTETPINPLRSGGGGVELGIALALDKPVVVIGPLDSRWLYLGEPAFDVWPVANWSAALHRLAQLELKSARKARRSELAHSRAAQPCREDASGPGEQDQPGAGGVRRASCDDVPDRRQDHGPRAATPPVGELGVEADRGAAADHGDRAVGRGDDEKSVKPAPSLWCRFGLHRWKQVTRLDRTVYLRCDACGLMATKMD